MFLKSNCRSIAAASTQLDASSAGSKGPSLIRKEEAALREASAMSSREKRPTGFCKHERMVVALARGLTRRLAGVRSQAITLVWLVFISSGITLAQEPQTDDGQNVRDIVLRMMAVRRENRNRSRTFLVKRDYRLFDQNLQPKAHVVARIVFVPPDQQHYRIEGGRGGMAEQILKNFVKGETQPPDDPRRQEFSPDNYEFQLVGQEVLHRRLCYVLAVQPRRQERDLIRGRIWVDAQNYEVHRVEGAPALSPSWWLRDLHVLIDFANVKGMWLRTFMRVNATVRFRGRFVMESRDLEFRIVSDASSLEM